MSVALGRPIEPWRDPAAEALAISSEIARWHKVVKAANISVN